MSHLICNTKQCRKPLLQSAYVTTCSHIFCTEHGLNIIMEDDSNCPACGIYINKPQGIVRVNLNPDEVTKSVMLAGLTPEIIMDILTRGLGFWVYQLNEENSYLESGLKTANENIAALGDYCEHTYAKYKRETNSLNSKIQSLNEELESNKKRCEDLIQQLEEKTKIINKLQLNRMQKTHLSAKNTTEGINKQETALNYFNQQFTPPQSPMFEDNASYNQNRLLKQEESTPMFSNFKQNNNFILRPELISQEQYPSSFYSVPESSKPQLSTFYNAPNAEPSTPMFSNFTQNNNYILKPESMRQQKPFKPNFQTPYFKAEDQSNAFSSFSPKLEETEPFPAFSPQNAEPNTFPPMHPFNNQMDSNQEFNFQPHLD